MADPYQTLGLAKTATDEEIRKAYRKLAKEHHPDLNPGNKQAEARFKEISAAYTVLSDPEKRRAFDAGEIDAEGQPRAGRQYYRDYAGADAGFRYERPEDLGGFEDLGDVFADLMRAQRAGGRGGGARAGAETHFRMRGGDAALHASHRVPGGRKRRQEARGHARRQDAGRCHPRRRPGGPDATFKGQGMAGLGGGAAGDALIAVTIRPHPVFRRDGADVRSVLPITLNEALSGGSVPVETITGTVSLKIPKHSNTGRILRLRGKGVQGKAKGDHLVELQVAMPPHPDEALEKAVADWENQHPYNPRGGAR